MYTSRLLNVPRALSPGAVHRTHFPIPHATAEVAEPLLFAWARLFGLCLLSEVRRSAFGAAWVWRDHRPASRGRGVPRRRPRVRRRAKRRRPRHPRLRCACACVGLLAGHGHARLSSLAFCGPGLRGLQQRAQCHGGSGRRRGQRHRRVWCVCSTAEGEATTQ